MGYPTLSERLAHLLFFCVLFPFSLLNRPIFRDADEVVFRPANQFSSEDNAPLLQIIRFEDWELVTALAWSPDQTCLVVAAGNQLVGYQTDTWQVAWEQQVPAFVTSMKFSHDGSWLATGGRDGKVRVWSYPHKFENYLFVEPSLVIDAHKKGVNSVDFDPGSNFLASGGNDAVVRFWDLRSGEKLGQVIGGAFAVPAIAFSPDGKVLAVVNGKDVRLREVGTERIVGTIQAEQPLYNLVYHPQENFIVTGSTENQVDLWDASLAFRTGQEKYPVPERLNGHQGMPNTYRSLVWQVAFNPQGTLLATAGGDAVVRIWDYQKKNQVAALLGHSLAVSSVMFSPDGNYLASGSLDASVRIWKISTP